MSDNRRVEFAVEKQTDTTGLLGGLLSLELNYDLCGALAEIIIA